MQIKHRRKPPVEGVRSTSLQDSAKTMHCRTLHGVSCARRCCTVLQRVALEYQGRLLAPRLLPPRRGLLQLPRRLHNVVTSHHARGGLTVLRERTGYVVY